MRNKKNQIPMIWNGPLLRLEPPARRLSRPAPLLSSPLPCAPPGRPAGHMGRLALRSSADRPLVDHPLIDARELDRTMMGRDHALSGALVFAGLAPALHVTDAHLAAGIALCAGAGVLPDIDH